MFSSSVWLTITACLRSGLIYKTLFSIPINIIWRSYLSKVKYCWPQNFENLKFAETFKNDVFHIWQFRGGWVIHFIAFIGRSPKDFDFFSFYFLFLFLIFCISQRLTIHVLWKMYCLDWKMRSSHDFSETSSYFYQDFSNFVTYCLERKK